LSIFSLLLLLDDLLVLLDDLLLLLLGALVPPEAGEGGGVCIAPLLPLPLLVLPVMLPGLPAASPLLAGAGAGGLATSGCSCVPDAAASAAAVAAASSELESMLSDVCSDSLRRGKEQDGRERQAGGPHVKHSTVRGCSLTVGHAAQASAAGAVSCSPPAASRHAASAPQQQAVLLCNRLQLLHKLLR
jgi:hypothetical protein